ncbi:hypothetical protein [Shinella sp. M31]|uniref:hypothetical protein n=1 Tax=Shinella sp. M31 TaxID=3368615 RepID=UPI003B9FDA3C
MNAIELASFRVRLDVDEASLQTAIDETNRWLAIQTGFVLRRHGSGDGRERIDYVEWQRMDHAMAAAERFMAAPETQAYMVAIETGSVSMHHFTLMP